MDIQRTSPPSLTLVVDTLANIARCTPVEWGHYTSGEMRIPAGSAYTTLTPYTSGTIGGVYQEHLGETNGSEAMTVTAGKNRPVNISVFAAKWVKFVADAAGTVEIDPKG